MMEKFDGRSRRVFFLRQLVDEVAQSLVSSFSDHAIDVFIDVPEEQMILADRKLIGRAVEQLMLNAIEAMPNGGLLVATSAVADGAVELEIADTGSTMSEAARRDIFHPFAEGDSGEASYSLEVARRIAELHHGSVFVANCPEGGAAFTLRIPISVALEDAA